MIIALPKDLIKIEKTRKSHKKRFSFNRKTNRMTIPREILDIFSSKVYGVDIWVSKKEKCAYLKFVKKEDAYFSFNNANGYVVSKDLFNWFQNQEIPIFDDYDYIDYQIDKKNKIVKVNLERE